MPTDPQELRAKAEAATKGPWWVENQNAGDPMEYGPLWTVGSGPYDPGDDDWIIRLDVGHKDDADFVAACDPDTIVSILDALEQANTELSSLREAARRLSMMCRPFIELIDEAPWEITEDAAKNDGWAFDCDVSIKDTLELKAADDAIATLLDPSPTIPAAPEKMRAANEDEGETYCGVLFDVGRGDALYCNRPKEHEGLHARCPWPEKETT